jgi:hypothetical protein
MSGSIVKNAIALNEAAAHNIVFVISSSQAKLVPTFWDAQVGITGYLKSLDNSLFHSWLGNCFHIL